uniref:EamA domain-containing protein n=1 Tax=Leptocylindrus danicus TaxID=163516 RepID=A0A7S2KY95_9STRA|mmetsp:Transcript_28356/g.41715  ORF Transcript_28356/g.41715 Transcript_28356/m.41715 type:complete len:506 (+) Transcript_28356:427-1944(+)|eukprot:CAMPEP_0116008934 /NCGR_PEP_ID=MMETSP0321-20121206/3146_1 /TAXON_ID=163516 /ORGANISM="Leptocylindrus danicus var. danicus, Strain B650" /LENGTH=505 /DNA_ID=CAMNT_0003477827 /DNA_START=360 /DNA_END=1877 /DNA_ORIENTATION=+
MKHRGLVCERMLLLFIASYPLLRLVERAECFSITGNSIPRRPVVQQQLQLQHATNTLAVGGSISFINNHNDRARRKYNSKLHPAAFRLNSVSDTDTDTSISVNSSASGMGLGDEMESSLVIDEEGEDGSIVCARGICVVADDEAPELCRIDYDNDEDLNCVPNDNAVEPGLSFAFLWPRVLLLICSVLYGTNFPLGRLMNDSLPASAATSARMLLASVALSPFLFQLKPELRWTAMLCGSFTALGYVSQSIALVDTPAATVSFLGALVVIVCPALAVLVNKKKMGFSDAPQTWISASLCLIGVGLLELGGDSGFGFGDVGWGDFWSVLQAVGFGTSFFITERMMAKEPTQALPITAVQCAMSAAIASAWSVLDGIQAFDGLFSFGPHGAWLLDENVASSFTLPGLFLNIDFRAVAGAAAFTGFITTAANRVGETIALGKLSSSEASVLLATEPLWAAIFANYLIGEQLGFWDAIGGALIVVACVATALEPEWLREKLGIEYRESK